MPKRRTTNGILHFNSNSFSSLYFFFVIVFLIVRNALVILEVYCKARAPVKLTCTDKLPNHDPTFMYRIEQFVIIKNNDVQNTIFSIRYWLNEKEGESERERAMKIKSKYVEQYIF